MVSLYDEVRKIEPTGIRLSLKQKHNDYHHIYEIKRPEGDSINIHVVTKEGNNLEEMLNTPTFACIAPGDFRLEDNLKRRSVNIGTHIADTLVNEVHLPDGSGIKAIYADRVVEDENTAADIYDAMRALGATIAVTQHDSWLMPRATTLQGILRMAQRDDMPILHTGGNNPGLPGVVGDKAVNGMFAQGNMLSHHIIGNIDPKGETPRYEQKVLDAIVDWGYAAVTKVDLRGKRMLRLGRDSMGMETAMAHVWPNRMTFGLDCVPWDMKIVLDYVDDLMKAAASDSTQHPYARLLNERTDALLAMTNPDGSKKVELTTLNTPEKVKQSQAVYLIAEWMRLRDRCIAVETMGQLEWTSIGPEGYQKSSFDQAETWGNSSFDVFLNKKIIVPYSTEADNQRTKTMLALLYLSGGEPQLFMDDRIIRLASDLRGFAQHFKEISLHRGKSYMKKGIINGNNSGSAALDYAAKKGATPKKIMDRVTFPAVVPFYFRGMANSTSFRSPEGIYGVLASMAFAHPNIFSMYADTVRTVSPKGKLGNMLFTETNPTWPESLMEFTSITGNDRDGYTDAELANHMGPANHFVMCRTDGSEGQRRLMRRMQYFSDMVNMQMLNYEAKEIEYTPGLRPTPTFYNNRGGERATKIATATNKIR